eukprot:SAG31_NODE_1118_length_9816_cov_41.561593_3_plen_65_part_00
MSVRRKEVRLGLLCQNRSSMDTCESIRVCILSSSYCAISVEGTAALMRESASVGESIIVQAAAD